MSRTMTLTQLKQKEKAAAAAAAAPNEGEDDVSTETYFIQAIEAAGIKIKNQRKALAEEKGKNEIALKVLKEKVEENKRLKGDLEIERKRVEVYAAKNNSFTKETISSKINEIFSQRDKQEEEEVKRNLSAYEEFLRNEMK